MKDAILKQLNPEGKMHLTDSQKKWQTKAEIKQALTAETQEEIETADFEKALSELLAEGKIKKRLREDKPGSPNEYTDTL